jgi:hypothetical protein
LAAALRGGGDDRWEDLVASELIAINEWYSFGIAVTRRDPIQAHT